MGCDKRWTSRHEPDGGAAHGGIAANESEALLGQQTDRGGKAQPMLIAKDLQRYFPIRGGILNRKVAEVKAVDGVSFTVLKGETLGVVGESGCGKSTLARLLMHLLDRDAGELIFDGDPVGVPNGLPLRELDATCRWCSRTAIRR